MPDELELHCHLNEAGEECFSLRVERPCLGEDDNGDLDWGCEAVTGLGENLDGLTEGQARTGLASRFAWSLDRIDDAIQAAENDNAAKRAEHLADLKDKARLPPGSDA